MALQFSVTPKIQEDFSGGQNDRDNPAIIADNEAAIQNWHIDKKGKLYKRGGLTLKGNDKGSTKILGLDNFYRGTTNHDLVMMTGSTLYYFNSSGPTWDALDNGFTSGKTTEFETANDILFITNGTDNVHSWDRAAVNGTIGAASFTGTGLDDATFGGAYYGGGQTYRVEIDATGTPDTFKWSDDGGSTWEATGVAITGSAQDLNNGVTVTFGATTGHTLADYWDSVCTSCLTDEGATASDPPKCTQMKWHRNYMFFAGNSTNNDRLYVSNLNDPQTCDQAADYFTFDYFTFEDPIIALGELKDFLIVFGERRTWTLQIVGTTLSDWVIEPINDARGCVAPRSIQRVDNDLYYMSNDGVRSLLLTAEDKVRIGRLSDKIGGTIDSINDAKIGEACSAFYENKYYIAFATGSSAVPNKTMVLDTIVGGWTTITGWTPSVFAVYNDNTNQYLYMGEASADSKVYTAELGATDNGTNIDADFQGKALTMGFPDRYKRWYRFDGWAYDTGDYNLTVEQNNDDGGFATLGTMNLQTGGPTLPFTLPATLEPVNQVYKPMTGFSGPSKQIQIRLRNNEATSGTTIHKYALHYKLKKYGY